MCFKNPSQNKGTFYNFEIQPVLILGVSNHHEWIQKGQISLKQPFKINFLTFIFFTLVEKNQKLDSPKSSKGAQAPCFVQCFCCCFTNNDDDER